jgi:hypothetical protein
MPLGRFFTGEKGAFERFLSAGSAAVSPKKGSRRPEKMRIFRYLE